MSFFNQYFQASFSEFVHPSDRVDITKCLFDKFIFYCSFVASICALYLFSIQGSQWILITKQVILVATPLIIGCRLLFLRRINRWFFIFTALVLIYVFFTSRVDVIAEYILLSWMLLLRQFEPKNTFTKKDIRNFGFLLCIIVGLHFIFFDSKGRESIGGLDPNYTSFLIFLIIPFAYKSRSYTLHIVIFFLGLLTKSRGFFVSINAYLFTIAFMHFFPRFNFNFIKFILLFVTLSFIVIVYSFIGYSAGIDSYGSDDNTIGRFLNLMNNRSDYGRWESNVLFLKAISRDYYLVLTGITPGSYFQRVSSYLPHNLPLLVIATHGLLIGSLFLFNFVLILKAIFRPKWLPFLMGILVYWLFLGIEIGAVYNVYLVSVLLILADEPIEAHIK